MPQRLSFAFTGQCSTPSQIGRPKHPFSRGQKCPYAPLPVLSCVLGCMLKAASPSHATSFICMPPNAVVRKQMPLCTAVPMSMLRLSPAACTPLANRVDQSPRRSPPLLPQQCAAQQPAATASSGGQRQPSRALACEEPWPGAGTCFPGGCVKMGMASEGPRSDMLRVLVVAHVSPAAHAPRSSKAACCLGSTCTLVWARLSSVGPYSHTLIPHGAT
jgi:hypothetical protein